MTIRPSFLVIVLVSLIIVLVTRLTIRLSAQWRVLKRNWSWKDEIMDFLFYFVLLVGVGWGLFKLIEILPS